MNECLSGPRVGSRWVFSLSWRLGVMAVFLFLLKYKRFAVNDRVFKFVQVLAIVRIVTGLLMVLTREALDAFDVLPLRDCPEMTDIGFLSPPDLTGQISRRSPVVGNASFF